MKLNITLFLFVSGLIVLAPNLLFSAETESDSNKPVVIFAGSKEVSSVHSNDERTKKIIFQNTLEKTGQKLLKEKRFDEAIIKFQAAAEIDKELYGNELGGGYADMARAYEEQGKYELALERVSNLLKDRPNQESFVDWKMKLEAFIKAEKERSNQPIYDYIKTYMEKYKKDLPPKKYWAQSAFYASKLIQLYDRIGDTQGGIAFVDKILAYPKLGKQAREEFLKIKQAFMVDKMQGAKGGATSAIIQSTYFPW